VTEIRVIDAGHVARRWARLVPAILLASIPACARDTAVGPATEPVAGKVSNPSEAKVVSDDVRYLGFADTEPAVYLALKAGTTVALREIGYDAHGRVAGFEEEIGIEGRTTRLRIATDPALQRSQPATYRYTALVDGRTIASPSLAEWERTEARGCLGFSPSDLGGVVLRSLGTLAIDATTRFDYDDFGRRRLAEQEFAHEGVRYRIAYRDYAFDEFGRLGGYTAEVRLAE
jgi:hypothetical protein